MPEETNLNQQNPTVESNLNNEVAQQSTQTTADFSAESQDFSYFDPTQSQEPQTQAPVADYYTTGDYTNLENQTPQAPLQDYTTQNIDPYQVNDPNVQSSFTDSGVNLDQGLEPQAPANTFKEQKTGNRKLLFIAIGVVVVLLITAGVLVYINLNSNTNSTTPTPSTPQQQNTTNTPVATAPAPIIVDNTATGGDNTPATKARVNTDNPTKEWFKKSFVSPAIDSDGNCLILETCGADSDKDKDGLTTNQEYQYGSDPLNEDTDLDGIADGDEIFIYYSDPSNNDSDNDTYRDGSEITACYDSIEITTSKLNSSRLETIATNVSLKTLHEPTIKTLKTAGATQSDLNSKGVVSEKCPKPSDTTTTSTNTSTNSSIGTTPVQNDVNSSIVAN